MHGRRWARKCEETGGYGTVKGWMLGYSCMSSYEDTASLNHLHW